jgi:hypothetical protein
MSKQGWVLIVLWSVIAGCSEQNLGSALPTLTLVPPTATVFPTEAPLEPTRDPQLTSPESLLTAAAPISPLENTPASSIDDPIAAELVLIAQQQVAAELGISIRRVRLVSVTPMRWADSSLGCPQPDQVYTEIEVDGYQIELRASETTYVFHTDFDRVVPCNADAETDI